METRQNIRCESIHFKNECQNYFLTKTESKEGKVRGQNVSVRMKSSKKFVTSEGEERNCDTFKILLCVLVQVTGSELKATGSRRNEFMHECNNFCTIHF